MTRKQLSLIYFEWSGIFKEEESTLPKFEHTNLLPLEVFVILPVE